MRQAAAFAISISVFDPECRSEIRMKEGLQALVNCLSSENPYVQAESLIALANCAWDIRCKQTLAALDAVKVSIELLASDTPSVVANACVLLSRLVFDYVSGMSFIEAGGVDQLHETLSKYCSSYDKFLQNRHEATEHGGAATTATGDTDTTERETDAPDELEIPDLRLGRAIVEACKSCAEQSIVREQIGRDGSVFKNICRMVKHEVRRLP